MGVQRDLEAFQAEVAWVALRAIGPAGFALAGAGALIAHGVVTRPTEDLDLFSPTAQGPAQVSSMLQDALRAGGYEVTVLEAASQHGGEFVRLNVQGTTHRVQVDVARDWRQHPPVQLAVGPVLHLDDAVASKVAAMIGRGLPRDYLDVFAAGQRFDRERLLLLAFQRDPGLRVLDVALAMRQLDRLPDEPFIDYGITPAQVEQARRGFDSWPRDAAHDLQGKRAHDRAQLPLRQPADDGGIDRAGPPTSVALRAFPVTPRPQTPPSVRPERRNGPAR